LPSFVPFPVGSKCKQQDRDHSRRAPDQRVQEHSQDLPIVAVFCQTDGVADKAARPENEFCHGVVTALDGPRHNGGITQCRYDS